MTNDRWALLDNLTKNMHCCSDLPPEIMIAIADRIDEALTDSSSASLKTLSDQLTELVNKMLHVAPAEAADAVRGGGAAGSAESAAYMLGQASFAQLLSSQISNRGVTDDFLIAIRDPNLDKYFSALLENDRTESELVDIVAEPVDTISLKINNLRALGITDFYQDGDSIYNFLTSAARAVLDEPARQQIHVKRWGDKYIYRGDAWTSLDTIEIECRKFFSDKEVVISDATEEEKAFFENALKNGSSFVRDGEKRLSYSVFLQQQKESLN